MRPQWFRVRGLINNCSTIKQSRHRRLRQLSLQHHHQSRLFSSSSSDEGRLLHTFADSDGESEHTGGVVDDELYHRPSSEELSKLGFDKPNPKAKFTALCTTVTKHPQIVAVKRQIPPSNVVHLVKRKHQAGIEFNGDDSILTSKYYKEETDFIHLCTQNLEIDYDCGGFVSKKSILKTEAFQSSESTSEYAMKSRDYGTIRNAIQDRWGDCTGRNALHIMLVRALNICDTYRDYLRLPWYEEPLRVNNIGGDCKDWNGALYCNYSFLEENIWDDLSTQTKVQQSKYIEQSWDAFDEFGSKCFVPDVQVFKMDSLDYAYNMEIPLTVKISKDDVIGLSQIRQSWNQALVGLQNSHCTYVLTMSLYSAHLMKIEILTDGSVFTSEKWYSFESSGSNVYHSEVLVELFGDLMRILWNKTLALGLK